MATAADLPNALTLRCTISTNKIPLLVFRGKHFRNKFLGARLRQMLLKELTQKCDWKGFFKKKFGRSNDKDQISVQLCFLLGLK